MPLSFINPTGRLGYQKKVRKLIRMLTFSAGIQVVVWQECFNRWRVLDDKIYMFVVVTSVPDTPMQQVSAFHQSFQVRVIEFRPGKSIPVATLFLAALCGACYGDDVQTFSLDKIVPREMIPDKLRVIENPRANISWTLLFLI
jgi:hypothetical protein